MHKKLIDALYVLNILFQALYTLALPIGLGALAAFLLTKYAGAPGWIWVILLILGVFIGLFSMIRYILTAMSGLERLEKQRERQRAEEKEKAERIARLQSNINESDGEINDRQ